MTFSDSPEHIATRTFAKPSACFMAWPLTLYGQILGHCWLPVAFIDSQFALIRGRHGANWDEIDTYLFHFKNAGVAAVCSLAAIGGCGACCCGCMHEAMVRRCLGFGFVIWETRLYYAMINIRVKSFFCRALGRCLSEYLDKELEEWSYGAIGLCPTRNRFQCSILYISNPLFGIASDIKLRIAILEFHSRVTMGSSGLASYWNYMASPSREAPDCPHLLTMTASCIVEYHAILEYAQTLTNKIRSYG